MPNKNYLRGTRYERELMHKLKPKNGFVIRASGSHGPFDVIVVDLDINQIMFIQCKTVVGGEDKKEQMEAPKVMGVYFEKYTKGVKSTCSNTSARTQNAKK